MVNKASIIILIIALLVSISIVVASSTPQSPAPPLHTHQTRTSAAVIVKREGLEGMNVPKNSHVCTPEPGHASHAATCSPPPPVLLQTERDERRARNQSINSSVAYRSFCHFQLQSCS